MENQTRIQDVEQPLKTENNNDLHKVDISFKDIRYSVFVKNTDKKKVADRGGKSKFDFIFFPMSTYVC
jgi:hypothetical protein